MKMIPEVFVMLKSMKVEIKKRIKCSWLTRPLVSSKRARERKGTSIRMASKLPLPWRSPKLDPSLKPSASNCKGNDHWKWKCPRYLADKKDGKVNKGILDIHVIDVYFTSVYSNPSVFDTGSVAKSSNSKRELQNKKRLVKGEVMLCVGSDSKVDKITITLPLPSGLVLNLK